MSDNDLTVVRGGKILLPTDLKMDFSLLRYCHFKPKMIVFLTALYMKTTKQVMIQRLPHLNTGTGFFCCSGLLCRYFCFWCWFWWSGGLYKNAICPHKDKTSALRQKVLWRMTQWSSRKKRTMNKTRSPIAVLLTKMKWSTALWNITKSRWSLTHWRFTLYYNLKQ